jgi:hypothetical protein
VQVTVGPWAQEAVAVTSIRDVAQVHLQDRIGRMVAQQIASMAVKAGIAAGVGALTRSEGLGVLTFALFALANAPDLRSWLSLPGAFALSRFRLPAGMHAVTVTVRGRTTQHRVEVEPGRVRLIVLRRY